MTKLKIEKLKIQFNLIQINKFLILLINKNHRTIKILFTRAFLKIPMMIEKKILVF